MGIPASKSHSLIAGITGGAIALNGMDGVIISEWMKVIYGMVFSLVVGYAMGWLLVKLLTILMKNINRFVGNQICTVLQNILATILAGLHGAQDGQKFMSIAILGMALVMGYSGAMDFGEEGFPL